MGKLAEINLVGVAYKIGETYCVGIGKLSSSESGKHIVESTNALVYDSEGNGGYGGMGTIEVNHDEIFFDVEDFKHRVKFGNVFDDEPIPIKARHGLIKFAEEVEIRQKREVQLDDIIRKLQTDNPF